MAILAIDKNKRGKLVAIALIVTSIVVLSKLIQQSDVVNIYSVFLNGFFVGILSYVGLLWALNFQITLRSLTYVLSQSALVVFILTVFLEIFVFRRVGRVYEILILLSVSGIMFFVTYASYLMANIFNVAQFKEIPLVQVAKTTSMLLTLLSIYFITFSVLEISVRGDVTIILLALIYFFIILFHFRHLGIQRSRFWKSFFTVFVYTLLISGTYLFIGGNSLVFSIVPSVVAYSLINLTAQENISTAQKFEYYLITLTSVFLIIFTAS